jgi:hypothetical protein
LRREARKANAKAGDAASVGLSTAETTVARPRISPLAFADPAVPLEATASGGNYDIEVLEIY